MDKMRMWTFGTNQDIVEEILNLLSLKELEVL